MKLIIGEAIKTKTPPKNAYVIECEAMSGDADGSKLVKLGEFKAGSESDMKYLEEAINLSQRLLELDDRDSYRAEPGFYIWFGDEYVDGLEEDDPRYELGSTWKYDPMSDYQKPCKFRSYDVFYFDDTSQKFNVSVEFGN